VHLVGFIIRITVISPAPARLACADFTEAELSSIMLGFMIKNFTSCGNKCGKVRLEIRLTFWRRNYFF